MELPKAYHLKELKAIAFLLLFSIPVISSGQEKNLVLNPSFSQKKDDGFLYWQHYFAQPRNFTYDTRDGRDTAALFTAESFGKKPKSNNYHGGGKHFIYGRLKEPLAAGTYYRIGLSLRKGDSSFLLLNDLGIGFKKFNPPAFRFDLDPVNLSHDWLALEDVYLAKGGEKYIYIGKLSEQTGYEWNDELPRKKYHATWERFEDGFQYFAVYSVDDVLVEKLPFQPSFSGTEKFSPDDIFFETAKHHLSARATSYLLVLASFLRAHEHLLITVEGFADERGDDAYNLQLSGKRAITVAEFLFRHGVAKKRIRPLWYGSEGADQSSGYHLDRRVQFEILRPSQ